MKLGTFNSMIAAYMQRDRSTFVTEDGVDLIVRAANQAKRWAERQVNFELSRVSVRITNVNATEGALLSRATLLGDVVETVAIKAIEMAFLPFSTGSGYFPITVISRAKHVDELRRHYENAQTTNLRDLPAREKSYYALVRHGERIYVSPAADFDDVRLDVVRWTKEYTSDEDNDFFLDYCEDFMKFRTVYELNFMLKEDVRVPISQTALLGSWATVLSWNSSMIMNSAEDANLD